MSTHRKLLILSINILLTSQITHVMQHKQQIVPLDTTKKDLILFGAGMCAGAACLGTYYLLTNRDEKINTLEKRIHHLEKNDKLQDQYMYTLKDDQNNETKRLDQTREWIFDEKEKCIQLIQCLDNNKIDTDNLKNRISELEEHMENLQHEFELCDQNKYFTPSGSSETE